MPNCHQKIKATLDRMEQLPSSGGKRPEIDAMATGLVMFRGQFERMLGRYSVSELDELLDQGAEWIRSLRSDG